MGNLKIGNVLSLFDGISGGQLALKSAGIEYEKYYASEIEESSIKVALDNFPDTIQLGTVVGVSGEQFENVDLLLGGSPCQGFSRSGKQLNFEDPRSKLFFEYVRILGEIRKKNPNVKFLLENVGMEQWCQDVISDYLKVYPIEINSALVSAQSRPRLYWTNIDGVEPPEDRNIMLKDIVGYDCVGVARRGRKDDGGVYQQQLELRKDGKSNALTTVQKDTLILDMSNKQFIPIDENDSKAGIICLGAVMTDTSNFANKASGYKITRGKFSQGRHVYSMEGKAPTLTAVGGGLGGKTGLYMDGGQIRKLSREEAEKIQTVPVGYTKAISAGKAISALGNGWTVEVIAHILQYMYKKNPLAMW